MIKQIILNNLYMLKYVWKNCKFLFVMTFVNTIIDKFGQLYLSVFIPGFLLSAATQGYSFKLALVIIGIYGVFELYHYTVVSYINSVTSPKTWNKLHAVVQEQLFRKAVEADLKCYDDPSFYDKYLWTMNECDSRIRQSMYMVTDFFGTILSLVLNFAVMIALTKISLIFIAISITITFLVQMQLVKLGFSTRENIITISRRNLQIRGVLYNTGYAKEIRTTNIKNAVFEKMNENYNEAFSVYRKILFKRILSFFILNFNQIIFLQFGLYIYLAFRITVSGDLPVGNLVVISAATMNAYAILSSISKMFLNLQENSLYVDKFKTFIDHEPEIKENKDGYILEQRNDFNINNLYFAYPNTENPALAGINLSIKHGQKIAIVGYNGSGKTTFVKMLLRLYDPEIGDILVNSKNLKSYNITDYRKKFGIVFQDFQCFSGTIAQNILMRDILNKEEDEKCIYEALEKCGLYEKIKGLPLGIYTILGREFDESGVIFSGGELQRLAIARIFARDCSVIILDEPSSALDPLMEYEFYQLVFDLFRDKTIIFISHRLATTKEADNIYMFENGFIIESGSHSELMGLNGKYARMYKVQEEKYK